MKITKTKKIKITTPILIEGLPGMGNVGKIATDFIIEDLKAKKIFEIYSEDFPNAVFVTENNLIELPKIEIYHKKIKNQDFLFLAGDIQPITENGTYNFCKEILNLLEKLKIKEIITLGGIGLQKIPKKPRVFLTGTNKKIISKYKSKELNPKIYGTVGPIIGVAGLLLGLAQERKIPAISLLAETFGHPAYIGVKGARELINILNKKFNHFNPY